MKWKDLDEIWKDLGCRETYSDGGIGDFMCGFAVGMVVGALIVVATLIF